MRFGLNVEVKGLAKVNKFTVCLRYKIQWIRSYCMILYKILVGQKFGQNDFNSPKCSCPVLRERSMTQAFAKILSVKFYLELKFYLAKILYHTVSHASNFEQTIHCITTQHRILNIATKFTVRT